MAGVLVLATALGGPVAWGQETGAPPVSETSTPAEPTTATTTDPAPAGTTTGTTPVVPAETPVDTATAAAPATPTPSPANQDQPSDDHAAQAQDPAPAQRTAPQDPVPAEADAAEADLRVTVAFDRPEYAPDSDLPITITVENVGSAMATDVDFVVPVAGVWVHQGWEQIRGRYTLAPGERMTAHIIGRQQDPRADHAEFTIRAIRADGGIADPTPADNEATARASVPQKRGQVSGVVYTDANGNDRFDTGEGVSGLEVFAYGGLPHTSLGAVTDGDGRVAFTDVPAGRYTVYFRSDDFVVRPGFSEFTVEENATADLALPTAAPISDVLTARLELDKDSYERDDQVNVKITLTNSGTTPLTGVVAGCNRSGESWVISGKGPGWAPLLIGGPGTTIGAGETKVLTIPDVVPQRAYEVGSLLAACEFGNNGRHADGYVGSSDTAKVVGARGDAHGLLRYHSGDGAETPLPGVRLLALNPAGLPIAEAFSGEDGTWRFTDLPVGDHEVLVLGPYGNRYSRPFRIKVDAAAPTSYLFSVVDGPPVVEPLPAPNVRVTASFDQPSYDIDAQQAKVTVKVVNVGNAPTWARFRDEWGDGGLSYDRNQWGDLNPYGPGAHLEPGAERDITLIGDLTWVHGEVVRLKGRIEAGEDVDPSDNVVDISAAITHRTGDAVAVVYGDRDLDGVFDDGEALPGVDVYFEGGRPRRAVSGRTDAAGRFRLDDVPAGTYVGRMSDDNTGWVREEPVELVVKAGEETTAAYGMVRPLSDRLHASVAFDRESYGVDDPVHLTITLSNSGDVPILVKASCGSAELPPVHNGPAWGPFASDGGSGVEIAAGETRTFAVQDVVPAEAADYGLFGAWCFFGPDDGVGLPMASDVARVPGAVQTTSGRAVAGTGPDPAGIPGLKLVLLDYFTGQPVARTVTGPDGGYTFTDLPVGYYTPVLVGPWKFNTNWGPYPALKVVRGRVGPVNLHFDPGPDVPDPDVAPAAPGQPGAGGGGGTAGGGTTGNGAAGSGLADTGASVLGLSLLGLLAVALGLGTRIAGRRRTA